MPRSHKYREPTPELIEATLKQYETRTAFALAHPSLYRHAKAKGLIDLIPDNRVRWTDEALLAEAAKYPTRAAFKAGNNPAYQMVIRRHLLSTSR